MFWGVAIPGLAMHNKELPEVPGLYRLQNPEVAEGEIMPSDYSLEEVAASHLNTIKSLPKDPATPFIVMGISMGAMIAAILGSKYRQDLPANSWFRLLSTSANIPGNPAIIPEYTQMFLACKRGDAQSFEENLGLLFSKTFRAEKSKDVSEFFAYRAAGGNQQSGKALFRQLNAIKAFNGQKFFSELNPTECTIICGAEDEVFGETHRKEIASLLPKARLDVIPNLGHMSSIEQPLLYRQHYG